MRFGPVPIGSSLGAVLAHTLRIEGATFTKGTVLGAEAVEALAAAGIHEVVVARLDAGDVGEDEAAVRLARCAVGPGVRIRGPFTGRCNLVADRAGLVRVDEGAVRSTNRVDESLTVATLPDWSRVETDRLVATVKVIPLAVRGSRLERAADRLRTAAPVVRVLPFRPVSAGLVLTTLAGDPESRRIRAVEVTRRRLKAMGSSLDAVLTVPHEEARVAEAMDQLRTRGCGLLLVLGASAIVDRADVVPRAVERIGGHIHRLGIPVDPGNLLLLASLDDAPVLGVPGCARSSRRSGFDSVLERLMVGVRPSGDELSDLGVGGLLHEIPSRPQPRGATRTGGSKGVTGDDLEVAGVILAAGRSRRMGTANKVLMEVGGRPMVVGAVELLRSSGLSPVVVVTGHEAADVEEALEGHDVVTVRNPRFREGMGTSLVEGIRAVGPAVDGALICLADMPAVARSTVDALVASFRETESEGPRVCVPVHRGKRGNPVLWSRAFFPELEGLTGDFGGRTVLSENAELVHEVPVEDPGVLLDVDTREALERARGAAGEGWG